MGQCIKLKYNLFILAFIACIACVFVSIKVYHQPSDLDEAINLQIAQALSQDFVYRHAFRPQRIHDPAISTNGPIQYLMALAIKFFGLHWAKVFVLSLTFPAFLFSIAIVSPFPAVVFSLLIFFWPSYLHLASTFVGPIAATTLCLWGFSSSRSTSSLDLRSGSSCLPLRLVSRFLPNYSR